MKTLLELANIEKESVIDPPKEELNPRFFKGNTLSERALKHFKRLLKNFISEIPVKGFENYIEQIIFVGSLAGYQWNYDSDIDLHIVVDSEELARSQGIETIELIQQLREFSKKFNKKFYVMGFPIEFYIQEKDEPFYSNGIYDVYYNTWIKKPEIIEYDKEKVKEAKEFAKQYKINIFDKIKQINKHIKDSKKNDKNLSILQNDLKYLKSEILNLKEKRNKAIRAEGDVGMDNMIIKFLGRMKVIKKIKDTIEKLENKNDNNNT